MTVVFVADEGVADSGFNASYQAVSLLDSKFSKPGAFINSLTFDHSFFPYFILLLVLF